MDNSDLTRLQRAMIKFEQIGGQRCRTTSPHVLTGSPLRIHANFFSDNDDGRGSLLLLSNNEEGLFRLSLTNGAIGRFDSVFFEWPSATKWIRLQSRCDAAARVQRKFIGALT